MNVGASTFVEGVNDAFIYIMAISFFFLLGITVVMLIFLYRYNRKRHPVAKPVKDSVALEITWTVIPIILVIGMFHFGYVGWIPMKKPPQEGVRVTANARMWSFSFTYDNGRITDKLYVPIDSAVIINLNALDVLHSFYIPAFRIKEDMVPGLANNRTWFQANQLGTYNIFCAEYCGLQHSYMITEVIVMEKADFLAWYTDTTAVAETAPDGADPVLLGRQLLQAKGCIACHSLDGTQLIGPTFRGAWGKMTPVVTGGTPREVLFDEEYLRRSIYEPDADIHQGFRPGQMISYKGEISEQQLEYLNEFFKSIQ
jgi:cytochrome c oxidase subunit II